MSGFRCVRPRILRPALSQRFQHLRCAQHAAAETIASTASKEPPITPTKPSLYRRHGGKIIWSTVGLAFGLIAGNAINHTIAPPPLPDAGTREDRILLADLNQRIDQDFKVQVLRGKCLGVASQLKGQEGGWVELVREEDAEATPNMISSLAGAKGLGVERLFWNSKDEKLVAVIWLGGSLSGWPGVAHGGVIATQLAEKFALAASLASGHHGQVTAAAAPQRLPGTGKHAKMALPSAKSDEPKQLSLSYVKPTYANGFYVIRVSPALPLGVDPAHIVPPEPASGHHEYEATLESLDAKVLVKAKAKFAPTTRVERAKASIDDGARWTYEQFKEWMWPSRQRLYST